MPPETGSDEPCPLKFVDGQVVVTLSDVATRSAGGEGRQRIQHATDSLTYDDVLHAVLPWRKTRERASPTDPTTSMLVHADVCTLRELGQPLQDAEGAAGADERAAPLGDWWLLKLSVAEQASMEATARLADAQQRLDRTKQRQQLLRQEHEGSDGGPDSVGDAAGRAGASAKGPADQLRGAPRFVTRGTGYRTWTTATVQGTGHTPSTPSVPSRVGAAAHRRAHREPPDMPMPMHMQMGMQAELAAESEPAAESELAAEIQSLEAEVRQETREATEIALELHRDLDQSAKAALDVSQTILRAMATVRSQPLRTTLTRLAEWAALEDAVGAARHVDVHAHACMHAYMRTCIHMRACVHACMRACVHACMRACVHTYMHSLMHACMHACIYIHTYLPCMRACARPCIRACMHGCMHTYTHTYTHTCTHA